MSKQTKPNHLKRSQKVATTEEVSKKLPPLRMPKNKNTKNLDLDYFKMHAKPTILLGEYPFHKI